jgi:hypothetical protein
MTVGIARPPSTSGRIVGNIVGGLRGFDWTCRSDQRGECLKCFKFPCRQRFQMGRDEWNGARDRLHFMT